MFQSQLLRGLQRSNFLSLYSTFPLSAVAGFASLPASPAPSSFQSPDVLVSTLLVKSPDAKGIAARLAQILQHYDCNITRSDHFTDQMTWMFFQRVCFQAPKTIQADLFQDAIKEYAAQRDGMSYQLQLGRRYQNMAVLVGKSSHCMWDLLIRHRQGELKANLKVVISNHRDLEHIAQFFGIPFVCIAQTGVPEEDCKPRMEAAIETVLQQHDVELIVLARYMQILSNDFCQRHADHTINIHHSFLPAFIGARAYHKAFQRGVKVIGATAHYATASLDNGPIIEQDVRRISHSDSVNDMVREGKDLERIVLARAVRWHLDNRVIIHDNKTVVFV